jgi:hypothetical protein
MIASFLRRPRSRRRRRGAARTSTRASQRHERQRRSRASIYKHQRLEEGRCAIGPREGGRREPRLVRNARYAAGRGRSTTNPAARRGAVRRPSLRAPAGSPATGLCFQPPARRTIPYQRGQPTVALSGTAPRRPAPLPVGSCGDPRSRLVSTP